MNEIKKYSKTLIGCVLISLGLNLFLIPTRFIPSGALGLTTFFTYNYGFNTSALLLIINVWTIWLIYMLYGEKRIKEYLLPSLLLPLFIYLTSFIRIDFTQNTEKLLIAIFGSVIMGYGYSLFYKEGYKIGAINILEDIFNDFNKKNTRIITRGFDILLVAISFKCYSLETTLYTIIVIVIIRYMTTKASIGISDSKAFYIITSKENEIKKYLMNELHHDLTVFDAEGGYSKRKNKILMTVISTKDYFKVKEGINVIDPKAFISITDNYEVMNKNIKINED